MTTVNQQLFLQSPLGDTLTQAALTEELMTQGHWQGRYRILMKLGQRMDKLPESLQIDSAVVAGCESVTWLHHRQIDERHYFLADSDSRIVRGLLVLVLAACNGKTSAQLASVTLSDWFAELGLTDHLSPSRSNGLNAVVQQIRTLQ
ncbi:SufE family protein [Ferrimonas lipolytica]|uniref:SufE family protein n=1 Tax=Ferrimonas lipolytica TaxID=2724191 RepID=A0A6H1UFC9_9GAMM|nr:SufE family protein [Ferrimonas lipolytica]QIZ77807.1 SufE family protein [Ferrimonas lipolytica]